MRIQFLILAIAFSCLLPQNSVLAADEKKSASEKEFCRLDKNNDREITFEEFKDCEFYKLERVRALIYNELKQSGPKGKTTLSDDELKAYLFKKADKNKAPATPAAPNGSVPVQESGQEQGQQD